MSVLKDGNPITTQAMGPAQRGQGLTQRQDFNNRWSLGLATHAEDAKAPKGSSR